MRTGRLSISRGHEIAERRAPPRPISFSPAPRQTALDLIHVRINALERLTRLVEQGTISLDEFRVEKALILQLTGGKPAPKKSRSPRKRRLRGWQLIPLAAFAGIGLSWWAQPDQTLAVFNQAAALFAG